MPAIGSVTPIGLIVVNVAEFIAQHLVDFRFAIMVLAFVSGTMLNSWALLGIYREVDERNPHHWLVRPANQELVLIAGMTVVLIASGLTAFFCYEGLAKAQDLPNRLTMLTSIVALGVPFAIRAIFDRREQRVAGSRRRRVLVERDSSKDDNEDPLP